MDVSGQLYSSTALLQGKEPLEPGLSSICPNEVGRRNPISLCVGPNWITGSVFKP
jgi:hypothetical protein